VWLIAPDVPVMVTVEVAAGVVALVETVRVSAVELPGVTGLTGLKPQVAPVGRPEQARVTGLLNPFSAASVRLYDALLPAVTVALVGALAVRVKPAAAPAAALKETDCITQFPVLSVLCASQLPIAEVIRCSALSPLAVLSTVVKLGPAAVTAVLTVAPATINSVADLVVQAPVSASAPLPELLTAWSTGLVASRPLYSSNRTSGDGTDLLKLTVIVFGVTPSPLMFFA